MTQEEKIKIPSDSILIDFKEHIDLEVNERILFTAPFGAGKSTFIDDFKNTYPKDYRFIRLYPVNYAVSANEDIFELIKFDILYELMAHHNDEISLVKEDFDFWLRMSMFMQNKADLMPLFRHIISLHETIGKPVTKFIEIIKPLVADFKEYTKEIKIDESDDIFTFLESIQSKKGSIYEMDATSQFIYDLICRLKGEVLVDQSDREEDDKELVNKTVLVIDDLDRLDPDHIFRLFNIFSAHTHSISGENKFGFDKVIFVCDIENIRKIYAHKYGQGVDFAGYMDKFYSLKPFNFDNFTYLKEKISEIIAQSVFQTSFQQELVKQDKVVYLLSAVLKILSKNRVINLRSIFKSNTFSLNTIGHVKIKNDVVLWRNNIYLYTVFEVISEMVGGWLQLEKALLAIKEQSYSSVYFDLNQKFSDKYVLNNHNYETTYLKEELFKILVAEYVEDHGREVKERNAKLHNIKLNVSYDLDYNELSSFNNVHIKEIGGDIILDIYINYDLLLIEAFRKLQDYGFIPKN